MESHLNLYSPLRYFNLLTYLLSWIAHTLTDNFIKKKLNSNSISKNFNPICTIGCARSAAPHSIRSAALIYGQTLKKMHSEQRTKTHTIHFFTVKYLAYIVNKTRAELAIKIKELVFRTFHSLF